MEALKSKRQAELEEKEIREQEEVAKKSVHRPGQQKLDVSEFNRAYNEKMEVMRQKKLAKQEILTRE